MFLPFCCDICDYSVITQLDAKVCVTLVSWRPVYVTVIEFRLCDGDIKFRQCDGNIKFRLCIGEEFCLCDGFSLGLELVFTVLDLMI